MKEIKDKFSNQSQEYLKFRPHYPELLFSFLDSKIPSHQSAWDSGTGNGQVAIKLAERFEKVAATDISASQLKEAILKDNITYTLERAEKTEFPDNSFDLITVAQAIHWFDLDAFYKEVIRVAKPNAVLAVWGYHLISIAPDIDKIIYTFYSETMGHYWDTERKLVDDEYKFIPFPLEEFEVPKFEIVGSWDFEQVMGYFNSWSAVQNYIKINGINPVIDLEKELKIYWNTDEIKRVRFRIFARMGFIRK